MRPRPQRSLEQVHDGFWNLHREAGTLHTQALRLQPGIGLIRRREPLEALEARLDGLYTEFMNLEADLVAMAGQVPTGWNESVRHASTYQPHLGVADSVRGVLGDTSARLNGVGARLESLKALWFSVASIVLALASLVVAAIVGS